MNHSRLDLVFTASWVTAQLQDCFTGSLLSQSSINIVPLSENLHHTASPNTCSSPCICKPKLQTSLRADLFMQRRGRRTQRALPAFHSSLLSVTVSGERKEKLSSGFGVCMATEIHCGWWEASDRLTMLKEAVLLGPFII